ncbi:MAG: GntR family transcriptional regulator [Verrucomicrobiae bacterium]|nr:GntR family transcriptional regulator [Verrucomicrobiae bacterium]
MNFKIDIQTSEPVFRQIEKFLRNQIQSHPTDVPFRLPSTSELAREWKVSCATIDKAMDVLMSDGLIERHRRRGTFLKPKTDKAVIGILAAHRFTDEPSYFQRAMAKAIEMEITESQQDQWACYVYDGLSGLKNEDDFNRSPGYQRLMRDFRDRPFKGFIQMFRSDDIGLAERTWNLPVARFNPPARGMPTDVILDLGHFTGESVRFIAQKGLKTIAYLRTIRSHADDLDALYDGIQSFGLPDAEICQVFEGLGVQAEREAHEKTLKLISQWEQRKKWPDALLISDDIVTRGVTLALLQHGVKPEGKPFLVAMTNREIVHHYGLPVARYEYCVRNIAAALVDVLKKRLAGENPDGLPVKIRGTMNPGNS